MRFFSLLILLSTSLGLQAENSESYVYDGKIVRNISIQIKDTFEGNDLNLLYRTANNAKIKTKKKVILRELTFKSGTTLNKFHIKESARNLRTLRFVRKVEIQPRLVDAKTVDITVTVNDTWTIIPQASFSGGNGRTKRSIGLAESNLLGYGKRLGFIQENDDNRKTLKTVYDDRRFLGTANQLKLGFFDRVDGDIKSFSLEKPFRTFFDRTSYGINILDSDTAERLFRNGDERFIYRQNTTNFDIFNTITRGDPETRARRYSFGYSYLDSNFTKANQQDYDDLNVDPSELELDTGILANDRRFSGPYFAYHDIEPNFLSRNYIDRFERYSDYNIGQQFAAKIQISPKSLGSYEDAILFSTSYGNGYAFSEQSFFRGEIAYGGRYQGNEFLDKTARLDLRYYNILGDVKFGRFDLGKHTLAAAFTLDVANRLDRDQEFLLGGDTRLRGYKARTFTGDKRFVLNLEDRIHLYEDVLQLFSFGTVFFLDIGAADKNSLTDKVFADTGMGFRLAFPRTSGARVFRFDIALPLRNGPGEDPEDAALSPRFLFSASQAFDAFLRSEIIQQQRASVDLGL